MLNTDHVLFTSSSRYSLNIVKLIHQDQSIRIRETNAVANNVLSYVYGCIWLKLRNMSPVATKCVFGPDITGMALIAALRACSYGAWSALSGHKDLENLFTVKNQRNTLLQLMYAFLLDYTCYNDICDTFCIEVSHPGPESINFTFYFVYVLSVRCITVYLQISKDVCSTLSKYVIR